MKKRSKNRSRRNDSKKLRRHDDSGFSSDHDDSSSSTSFSSCSSSSADDRRRSKRSRSQTRKDMVGKKKKAQRRSYSYESSDDSPRVRKRKRSKRNHDYKSKKKTHLKKKPRRDASVSSTSGSSGSCSSCRYGSICSHEIEFKRHRSRPGEGERDETVMDKVKSRSEKNRYRSRSHSLCSQRSESSDYQSDKKVLGVNNFRRLQSIIIVVEKDSEGRELNMDEHDEEAKYSQYDYPPCRSNDSNHGGSKKDGDQQSHVGSEEKMRLEDETVVSNVRISKLKSSGKIGDKYGDRQCDKSTLDCDELRIVELANGKKSEVSGSSGSLDGDDLESLLRQRALENLRKFQGGLQTTAKPVANQKDKNYSDVKQLSPEKAEPVQMKSLKDDSVKVVGAKSSKEDDAGVVGSNRTQVAKVTRAPRVNKDFPHSSQNNEKIPDGNAGGNATVSAKQNTKYPTDRVAVSGNNSENINSAGSVQPTLVAPALMQHSPITQSTLKQALVSQESPREKLVVTETSLVETAAVTAPTVTESSNKHSLNTNTTCSSGAPEPSSDLKSTSGENTSNTVQNEVKEGSQFEQKTMSVMRGGEMVQVGHVGLL